jgi:hypothetical protein
MKAVNMASRKEYEVLDGATLDEVFKGRSVIDLDEWWFVLHDREPRNIEGMTHWIYEVDGKNLTGFYVPKKDEKVTIDIIAKWFDENFGYIPKKYITITEYSDSKNFRIEKDRRFIELHPSLPHSFKDSKDDMDVHRKWVSYNYMDYKGLCGHGHAGDWESIKHSLIKDLEKMGIKPTDSQMSIFDIMEV